MKILRKILCVFAAVLAVCIAAALLFLKLGAMPVSSVDNADEKRFEVPAGTSARKIAKDLKASGLIRSELVFYLGARFPFFRSVLLGSREPFSLKSGVYKISGSMSIPQIYRTLSSGQQEFIRVSVPEGLTVSKIALKLENTGVCEAEDFKESCRDVSLLEKYHIPAESFEGYLFPDTYFLTPSMSGSAVVSIMADTFFEKTASVPGLSELSPEKLNDVVILASIVEREYRIDEEAPLIASVFKNRLEHNIGLYSCATIEYIITEIEGREHPDVITYDDIAIDSPYNTYKWAGLPPGAISNPGIVALNAAAHPADTNYYYFRIVDSSKGKHVFSKNFSTHISEGYISNTKKNGN